MHQSTYNDYVVYYEPNSTKLNYTFYGNFQKKDWYVSTDIFIIILNILKLITNSIPNKQYFNNRGTYIIIKKL